MATIWKGWYWHLGLASLSAISGAIASCGDSDLAQITTAIKREAEPHRFLPPRWHSTQ